MLQTRSAKRPAQAAVRFAVDAVDEGLLTKAEAIATIDAGSLDALLHPTFDPDAAYEVLARGVAASPGAAKGAIVFTAEEAVDARRRRRDPGPAVHRGRRRRRASTPPGDPHLRGRQGLPRGAGRARHGPSRGHRRGRPGRRPARRRAAGGRAGSAPRRPDRDRREHGRDHHR